MLIEADDDGSLTVVSPTGTLQELPARIDSIGEIIQPALELNAHARWAKFVDAQHVVAALPILDSSSRYFKHLRLAVYSIVTGKVTATGDLPHVEHVSAFAFYQPTGFLCFGEGTNAHVYRVGPNNIQTVCA